MDTITPQTAGADQDAELIPTDPTGLYDYLRKLPTWEQCEVADRLAIQLGGAPEAIDRAVELVEDALRAIAHDNLVDQVRAGLAESIAAAVDSIQVAKNAVDRLSADDVGDMGGQPAEDLRGFLGDAGRMARAAAAVNPCPPKETNR